MSVLTTTHPTLLDVAKRVDPNGKVQAIAELLTQVNPILEDMPWKEGNLPTGMRHTIRTGLPQVYWKKYYGGIQPSKSTTAQVEDTCGMIMAYSEVDADLAELGGNVKQIRASEDTAFIQAMSQELASAIIYSNESTAPEQITGLTPRLDSTSGENAVNYLRSATSPDSSDNTSIWLVGWGPETVFGIYPKGSKAGIQSEDKGKITVENVDGQNGRSEMYRSLYKWSCGLSVKDWRYVVRIMIDQEDLVKGAATGPDLIDLMQQATELIPSMGGIKPVFYMNRTVKSFLKRQMVNKVTNSTLSIEQLNGKPTLTIEGIPCKRVDAILNTETFHS